MAYLTSDNGKKWTALADIQRELAPVKVTVASWPLGDDAKVKGLIGKEQLTPEEKETVLKGLDRYFEKLKKEQGYTSRDLIVLFPSLPQLGELCAKFDKCHTHDDVEVRYIIDGEGSFGFVRPDDSQVELTMQAGEYINVPANSEHWFRLTEKKRIKAVRYFSGTSGWVPKYTGTGLKFGA